MTTKKLRLSHSQQSSLNGCSLSWWIQRRKRMPQTTYWSTIAGSVFHERVEHFLLNGAWPTESVTDHVQRLVDDHLAGGPYTEADGIRVSKALPSGLRPADHPHGFNKAAVVAAIPVWVGKWKAWMDARKAEGWDVWIIPDEFSVVTPGLPGVEVEVHYELGGHPVIGSIDCVLQHRDTKAIWLVDWKAGRSKPDDTSQLDGYRIGFEEMFGIRPDRAGFFMVRTGKEHLTADYPTFTRSMLDVKFQAAGERAVRAEGGDFEIDPTRCQYLCSVADWCPVRNSDMVGVVLLPEPTVRNRS